MDRFRVQLVPLADDAGEHAAVSPRLLERLNLPSESLSRIRLGCREAAVQVRPDPDLPAGDVMLPGVAAAALGLAQPLELSAWAVDDRTLAVGPLVGLLVSAAKLSAVLAGKVDTIYCRYARYAEEAGAVLIFTSVHGLHPTDGTVQGYRHRCSAHGPCGWEAVTAPVPPVIYDRCFGREGREEAAQVRSMASDLGVRVVNHLVKITKLQAFGALRPYTNLAPYLPLTEPMTPESLQTAMQRYTDLYLKPDALYKGKGVYRLTRRAGAWLLQSREEQENVEWWLPAEPDLDRLVGQIAGPDTLYLIQEGLPLATYMGNRFDFRSLVQRDGRGRWKVTGLVARIAPRGSAITSPRSGGRISPPERVLAHAFPDTWPEVLAELERVSLELAEHADRHLGPCVGLGLDVGVLADGSVKLIEINGKPLRVSLDRLRDPLVSGRINRYPIHCAAFWAMEGVGACRG